VKELAADPALEQIGMGTTPASNLAAIAAAVAAGELAAAERDYDRAVDALRTAAAREDALTYDEPPDWPLPVRRNLGAVLLAAGRPGEAETAFREDLARFPSNPRALFGLAASLEAQGKKDEATALRQRLTAVSEDADEPITAARL
jgi:Flp pilus assembly protein TadD